MPEELINRHFEEKEYAVKLIRKIGIAAIATVAAMALIGASSAMAGESTALCSENEEKLCAAENIYSAGTEVVAVAQNTELAGTLSQKCEKTEVTTETISAGGVGNPLESEVLSSANSGCSPCSSYHVTASRVLELLGHRIWHNYRLTLLGCALGATCAFGATEAKFGFKNTEGGSPEITANKVPLTLVEGNKMLCGATATLSANYKVVSPSPVWLAMAK